MQAIKRGDIYYADLNPVRGSEQGGIRPVLILQNDIGNKHSPTVIVATITSQINKAELPTHIEIEGYGLRELSVVCLEQIKTIDKCRLRGHIGHLDDDLMEKVNEALNISLGIQMKKEGQAVANFKLATVEFKNQRVLTTQQLAAAYETETNNLVNNFARNKERFIEGVHYYFLKGTELQGLKNYITDNDLVPRNAPHFYLWTEKGASRHCKILDNDKAWQRFDELEDTYFRAKELSAPQTQIQILQQAISVLAEQEKELAATKQIAIEAKSEATAAKADADAAKQTITEIKNTIAELPKDQWRKWINNSVVEIVRSEKCKLAFDGVRNESYKLLEEKSRADLEIRVKNKKKRLTIAGAKKSEIDSFCKLDAIEEDKYLKEIYTNIVQKLRIKYLV